MIVYLIGTKAQYIKMAPVVRETTMRRLPMRLVFTGQHSETFEDLQRNFDLPQGDLTLVGGAEAKDRLTFARWLRRALAASGSAEARGIWREASVIVVHGDTASTLLGAYIGWRQRIPVAHIEAGLRSFDYLHPFPEELIRILVSRIADLHFCPDEVAAQNLAHRRGERLVTGGNTLKDSLRLALGVSAPARSAAGPYAVFSMHRQENLFNRERLDALLQILRRLTSVLAVKFVLHPVTLKRLEKLGLLQELAQQPSLELVPRMDFFSFIALIGRAAFVASDGGSNQEECALLDIPCVLLRRATERPDGLGAGVMLGDLDEAGILEFARRHTASQRVLQLKDAVSPSAVIVERLARFTGGAIPRPDAQVAGADTSLESERSSVATSSSHPGTASRAGLG